MKFSKLALLVGLLGVLTAIGLAGNAQQQEGPCGEGRFAISGLTYSEDAGQPTVEGAIDLVLAGDYGPEAVDRATITEQPDGTYAVSLSGSDVPLQMTVEKWERGYVVTHVLDCGGASK